MQNQDNDVYKTSSAEKKILKCLKTEKARTSLMSFSLYDEIINRIFTFLISF